MTTKPPEPNVPDLSNMRAFERTREVKPKPGMPATPSISLPSLFDEAANVVSLEPQREPERYKQLGVEEIKQYEDNPRTMRNSEFDTIKEALKTGGIGAVILHVTRRPGETQYTVSNGGNTRLKIIQELWEETQDQRFRAVRCLIQPFDSDVHMLARHVAENSQRGDLCFWDTAAAVVKLRQKLDAEFATTHSNRDFAERAKSYGLAINITGIAFYEFAVRTFGHFEFCVHLSKKMVERIQPLWSSIERLKKLSGLDVATPLEELLQSLDEEWFEKVGIDYEQLMRQITLTASQVFGFSLVEFEKAQELSRDRSLDTWDKLVQRTRLQKAVRPERTAATRPATSEAPSANPPASRPSVVTPPALTLPLFSPAPIGETRVARVYRLAALICHFQEFPKNTLQRSDKGVGWFLEPFGHEKYLAPNLYVGGAQMVQMHTWNVLAMLSGQWHRDVYEALPKESLWYRLLNSTEALKLERQCLVALPPPAQSWAEYVYGANPWGTRNHLVATSTGDWDTVHDSFMDLMNGVFELMREEPARFAQIRRYGKDKDVREVWE